MEFAPILLPRPVSFRVMHHEKILHREPELVVSVTVRHRHVLSNHAEHRVCLYCRNNFDAWVIEIKFCFLGGFWKIVRCLNIQARHSAQTRTQTAFANTTLPSDGSCIAQCLF
jgi:hypothetical protein